LWHFTAALNAIQPRIKKYEKEMISSVENGRVPLNQDTVDKYFAQARTMVRNWDAKLDSLPVTKPKWLFRRHWQSYSKLNGIE
jgi:hypothetical protein